MTSKATHRRPKPAIEVSTGNVFADLGFRDADLRLAKAKLATRILRLIETMDLSQQQISELSGLASDEICQIRRGQLGNVSPHRLYEVFNRLESIGYKSTS